MTPAPTPYHQHVSGNLFALLREYVIERRAGEVISAPCDVVLSANDVVQPDIFFITAERLSIIGERYISAAPDLVVEVLSPSTADRDQTLKAKLYARHGVRELWIADPEKKTVEVLVKSGEGFRRDALYGSDEALRSPLLLGLQIRLADVF